MDEISNNEDEINFMEREIKDLETERDKLKQSTNS
jgi:hypothetical protein